MTDHLSLILYIIAALGVIALVLVFFTHDRRIKTKLQTAYLEKAINTQSNNEDEPETIMPGTIVNSASLLAEINTLGFSAIDALFAETRPILETEIKPVHYQATPNSDLIIFYLLAPAQNPFVGYELLQTILAAGLRPDPAGIFHRYAGATAESTILFSLSSAVEPGVFDLANIGAFACNGLAIFMSISACDNPAATYQLMLETARQLAEDLQAELCDEQRRPLTTSRLEEYKQRIM